MAHLGVKLQKYLELDIRSSSSSVMGQVYGLCPFCCHIHGSLFGEVSEECWVLRKFFRDSIPSPLITSHLVIEVVDIVLGA